MHAASLLWKEDSREEKASPSHVGRRIPTSAEVKPAMIHHFIAIITSSLVPNSILYGNILCLTRLSRKLFGPLPHGKVLFTSHFHY